MLNKTADTSQKFYIKITVWILPIVLAIAVNQLVFSCLLIKAVVPSGSMEPTIKTRSLIIGYRVKESSPIIKRGEIIIFPDPDNNARLLIKRVVGLPGEIIEIMGDITKINGIELKEKYTYNEKLKNLQISVKIPIGELFVMGDNRNHSFDSRFWDKQTIPAETIIGKYLFSIPFFTKI